MDSLFFIIIEQQLIIHELYRKGNHKVNKKIVFFDIDGTLVDYDKNIPSSTRDAIKLMQEKGIIVALSTGRPPFLYEYIREELGIDTYISFTGQHVVYKGEVIYEQPIESTIISSLYKDAMKKKIPMMLMSDKEMIANIEDHPHMIEGLETLKYDYPPVHDSFHETETIYQVLLFLEEQYDETFLSLYHTCQFIRWHKYACDMLPGGGSKIVGVRKVLEAAGISNQNAYAFGDGLNDLEMIKQIGTGIAMGNAVQPLKNLAKIVTTDVDDNGVWNALKELGLIE